MRSPACTNSGTWSFTPFVNIAVLNTVPLAACPPRSITLPTVNIWFCGNLNVTARRPSSGVVKKLTFNVMPSIAHVNNTMFNVAACISHLLKVPMLPLRLRMRSLVAPALRMTPYSSCAPHRLPCTRTDNLRDSGSILDNSRRNKWSSRCIVVANTYSRAYLQTWTVLQFLPRIWYPANPSNFTQVWISTWSMLSLV